MYPLLESIRLIDGKIELLAYHQVRMEYSYLNYYNKKCPFVLYDILKNYDLPNTGTNKIRFLYNEKGYYLEVVPYSPKDIKTLQIVFDDTIQYGLKYTARTPLNNLYELRKDSDDVLIIKQKMITDTTYCNILLRGKDKQWYTPEHCLLKGVQRAKLIRENKIKERPIGIFNLQEYTHFMLINSMMPPNINNLFLIQNIKL